MSLRIEQNWKWSNKTLCVVSTSDKTTHCGICLTSNNHRHWASGRKFGPQLKKKFRTIFSLEIGILLGKCFRKPTNS